MSDFQVALTGLLTIGQPVSVPQSGMVSPVAARQIPAVTGTVLPVKLAGSDEPDVAATALTVQGGEDGPPGSDEQERPADDPATEPALAWLTPPPLLPPTPPLLGLTLASRLRTGAALAAPLSTDPIRDEISSPAPGGRPTPALAASDSKLAMSPRAGRDDVAAKDDDPATDETERPLTRIDSLTAPLATIQPPAAPAAGSATPSPVVLPPLALPSGRSTAKRPSSSGADNPVATPAPRVASRAIAIPARSPITAPAADPAVGITPAMTDQAPAAGVAATPIDAVIGEPAPAAEQRVPLTGQPEVAPLSPARTGESHASGTAADRPVARVLPPVAPHAPGAPLVIAEPKLSPGGTVNPPAQGIRATPDAANLTRPYRDPAATPTPGQIATADRGPDAPPPAPARPAAIPAEPVATVEPAAGDPVRVAAQPAVPSPAPVAVTPPTGPTLRAAIDGVRRDSALPARTPRDESLRTAASPAFVQAQTAPPVLAVAAAGAAQSTGIDLTRDPGLHRMIDRIESLRDAADARDTRVRLHPDALGTVDVAVRREGDAVTVHFTAADPATRTLIADAQPRLNELADARGVRIERTTVDGGATDGRGRFDGQPQSQPQPQAQNRTPRPALARAGDAAIPSTDDRIA